MSNGDVASVCEPAVDLVHTVVVTDRSDMLQLGKPLSLIGFVGFAYGSRKVAQSGQRIGQLLRLLRQVVLMLAMGTFQQPLLRIVRLMQQNDGSVVVCRLIPHPAEILPPRRR